jgi:predicted RNase H-like nuclease (RuvC/YqgF family)
MPSPPESSFHSDADRPPANETTEETFEQEVEAVERSLQALKDRYQQIQQDEQRRVELGHRREEIRQELRQSPLPQLKAELQRLEEQLEVLETNLESRLLSWSSLKRPFWQIVRFGGLGMVLGWFLAFAVIQSPKPVPAPGSSVPQSQGRQAP